MAQQYASITSEHGDSRPSSISSHTSRRVRHTKQNGVAGTASWLSSVINLVNTIVGAGVLAMPHAMSNMGVTLGTAVILWAGFTSGFGLYLQTKCARYLDRGGASFFALSQITYPNAAVFFDGAIMIKCFGVGVSYLIIIGDLMPGVVRGFVSHIDQTDSLYLVDRRFWITAFMWVMWSLLGSLRCCADHLQVNRNTAFVPPETGQSKVHVRHRTGIHRLSCGSRSLPLH